MTKAFISYHHKNDQCYRNHISLLAKEHRAFHDCSIELGDINDSLPTQTIRKIIRDEYLRDTQVTILLCGTETRFRKHVDWELKSSMIDGTVNKRSGILVIDLPTTSCNTHYTNLPREKEVIYPDITEWVNIETKAGFEDRYPDLPERIIDNLVKRDVVISVVPWSRIQDQPEKLKFLVDATARTAATNEYDCKLPMRMRDHYQGTY